jgi:hypothetical protein
MKLDKLTQDNSTAGKNFEEKMNKSPTEKVETKEPTVETKEPWPFDEMSEEAANIIIDIVTNDEQFKKYSELLKEIFPLEALTYPGLPPDLFDKTPTKENKA